MKLSKLRELTQNALKEIGRKEEIIISSKMNPDDIQLQKQAALAAAQITRIMQLVKNYKPVFTVRLGDFAQTVKDCYEQIGVESKLTCFDFHTNAVGKTQANLFLTLNRKGEEKNYNLCKIVLEDDNQPLADIKINLIDAHCIKGFLLQRRNPEIHDELDIIAWETITKTLKKRIEDNKIAKALREDELAAKRMRKEEKSI